MCDHVFVTPRLSQAGQSCAWGHQSLWEKPSPLEIGMSVMSPPGVNMSPLPWPPRKEQPLKCCFGGHI